MRTELKSNDLTLYLEGRIDSNHAAETEAAMLEAIRKYPGAGIVLDAKNLEYISSAGLREFCSPLFTCRDSFRRNN